MTTAREMIESELMVMGYKPKVFITPRAAISFNAAERVIDKLVAGKAHAEDRWAEAQQNIRLAMQKAEQYEHERDRMSAACSALQQDVDELRSTPIAQQVDELTRQRDLAHAAHAHCDRERQAALDRVREAESKLTACEKQLDMWREHEVARCNTERSDYRDRLDKFCSAIVAGGYLEPKEVKSVMKWATEYLAAVDAVVEGRGK